MTFTSFTLFMTFTSFAFTLFAADSSSAISFTLLMVDSCSTQTRTSTSASSSLPPSSSSHSSSQLSSLVADSRYSSALSTTCSIMSVSTFHSNNARRASSGCSSSSNGGPQPARAQYLALAWLNSFQAASTASLLASMSRRLSLLASSKWHLLIAAIKTLSLFSRVFLARISFELFSCALGLPPILSLVPLIGSSRWFRLLVPLVGVIEAAPCGLDQLSSPLFPNGLVV